MGIKFYCPNGHKLNVKSFLAGKRGICPHCGVKVDIPAEAGADAASPEQVVKAVAEATVPLAAAAPSPDTTGTPAAPQPVGTGVAPGVVPVRPAAPLQPAAPVQPAVPGAAGPVPAPLERAHQPAAPTVPSPTVPSAAPTAPTVAPATPAVSPAAPAVPAAAPVGAGTVQPGADPFLEAPNAVWYVRPPSGGQYGPASGDVMRGWIAEGRVSTDSLVWREGWPEWKAAGPLFPGVAGPGVDATPMYETPTPDTAGAVVSPGPGKYPVRRRRSPEITIAFIVMLSIAAMALFGALIYVINL